jgi:hypothetical protein
MMDEFRLLCSFLMVKVGELTPEGSMADGTVTEAEAEGGTDGDGRAGSDDSRDGDAAGVGRRYGEDGDEGEDQVFEHFDLFVWSCSNCLSCLTLGGERSLFIMICVSLKIGKYMFAIVE